jgi:hypothetical protein
VAVAVSKDIPVDKKTDHQVCLVAGDFGSPPFVGLDESLLAVFEKIALVAPGDRDTHRELGLDLDGAAPASALPLVSGRRSAPKALTHEEPPFLCVHNTAFTANSSAFLYTARMDIVAILWYLIIAAVLWWIFTLIPLPQPAKNIALAVVLLLTLIYFLQGNAPALIH